jgi:TonB family protein
MTQVVISSEFNESKETRWTVWLVLFAFAILLHALLFSLHFEWTAPSRRVPVEIQSVDPRKLDAVRKQWKEKGLLLDKDQSTSRSETAPEDARYFSDKNRRVEREQRAKDTAVLPTPGRPNPSTGGRPKEKSEPKPKEKPQRPIPKLGQLGIPLPTPKKSTVLDSSDAVASESEAPAVPQGGHQAILDKNLPVGGENILNTQESVYYSFYARMYEAVGPIWQSQVRDLPYRLRVNPGEYATHVDVVLDEFGNLLEIVVLRSSGIVDFDQVVSRSWKKIGKFPNPPAGLIDENKKVHIKWTFVLDVGEGVNFKYIPPERRT